MEDKTSKQEIKESPENKIIQERNYLSTVQSILTFVIGLGGLLTASGFIIVNIYLSRYTNIQVYDVNTGQYLAASIGALVFSAIFAVGLFVISFFGIFFVFLFKYSKNTSFDLKLAREYINYSFRKESLREISTNLLRSYTKWDSFLSFAYLLLILSLAYGVFIYQYVPRFLGGGEPVPIAVIFKDDKDLTSFGFRPLSSNHPDVVALGLLAELSDGILVYSVSNGKYAYAAVIKNDEIKGVLDLNSLASSEEYFGPESTEVPTSAVEVTATVEATSPATP